MGPRELLSKVASAALMVASVLLAGCAASAMPEMNAVNPYQRCGASNYVNADCYGGPP
jgi:hypothetical protein